MILVRITNPNPKPLSLIRDGVVQDVLRKHDGLGVPYSPGLRLSYSGRRAFVVFRAEGGDWDGEEWVQQIGQEETRIDPALAYVGAKAANA